METVSFPVGQHPFPFYRHNAMHFYILLFIFFFRIDPTVTILHVMQEKPNNSITEARASN